LCGFFSFLLMRFLSRFGRFSSFDLIWFFFFVFSFLLKFFFVFFFVFTYLFIDLFHFVFVFVISFVFVFWFIFTVEEDTAPWRADRLGPGRSKLGIERWTRPARDIFRDGHRPAFYNAPIRLFSKLGTKADECGQPPLRLGIGCGLGACVKCEPGRWWRHDAGGEERGQLTEDGCIDPNGIIGGGAPRCGGAILLAAPLPSSAFSSSRRFKQAAFGFRFLSANTVRKSELITSFKSPPCRRHKQTQTHTQTNRHRHTHRQTDTQTHTRAEPQPPVAFLAGIVSVWIVSVGNQSINRLINQSIDWCDVRELRLRAGAGRRDRFEIC